MRVLEALLWCSLAVASVVRPVPAHELPDRAASSVFGVRAYPGGGSVVQGSAVVLASGELVTNCHVVGTAERIEVFGDGQRHTARLATRNDAHDVCVLHVPGVQGPTRRRESALLPAEKIYAVGFGRQSRIEVAEGKVVALHDYDRGQVIQVSAPFDYGSSGGGLFDADGNLVGVLTFKARAGGSFHFAVPIAWLDAGSAETAKAEAARPFWQAKPSQLPYFLRAASLEAAGHWNALRTLATDWARDEPINPGAQRALAKAELHLASQSPEPLVLQTAAAQ